MTWTTVEHMIPYDPELDHGGYSNCMIFSADGKTAYALNNPPDPQNAGHAMIVFAAMKWK